jgi:hypothetical protein
MNIYPQLSTGAVCQFPIQKIRHYRTIVNQFEDGSRVVLQDPNATAIQWKLSYSGISDDEVSALQGFFDSVEGRLRSFTFVEPGGNLLAWSEDLSQLAWQKSTFLQIQTGVTDPVGSQRASSVTNSGAGALALVQTIAVPGSYVCCWSFFGRSDSPTSISLQRGTASEALILGPAWQRVSLTTTTSDGILTSDFGVTIPPGAQVNLFGMQVETQAAPSTYVQTLAAGGVYPSTRFDSDSLTFTADAPNSHSCQVSLYSRVNS